MNNKTLKNPRSLAKLVFRTVFIASLLVVFLPIFFARISTTIYLDKIPPAPKVSAYKLLSTADFTTPKVTQVNTIIPASAWLVQLDQYADPLKADELVKQLRQQGYPAYSFKKANDYVVLIGPETDKNRLVHWLNTLKPQHSSGKIVNYAP